MSSWFPCANLHLCLYSHCPVILKALQSSVLYLWASSEIAFERTSLEEESYDEGMPFFSEEVADNLLIVLKFCRIIGDTRLSLLFCYCLCIFYGEKYEECCNLWLGWNYCSSICSCGKLGLNSGQNWNYYIERCLEVD